MNLSGLLVPTLRVAYGELFGAGEAAVVAEAVAFDLQGELGAAEAGDNVFENSNRYRWFCSPSTRKVNG